MTWLVKLWEGLGAIFGLVNRGAVAAEEKLRWTNHELDRERRITAALRLRLAEKEGAIRALEKKLAALDPGAVLDGVFGGPAGQPT